MTSMSMGDRRGDDGWRAPLSDEELKSLAEEQAALRRVAMLVAQGAPLDEVFAAVAD
jgi:hypothetical protein